VHFLLRCGLFCWVFLIFARLPVHSFFSVLGVTASCLSALFSMFSRPSFFVFCLNDCFLIMGLFFVFVLFFFLSMPFLFLLIRLRLWSAEVGGGIYLLLAALFTVLLDQLRYCRGATVVFARESRWHGVRLLALPSTTPSVHAVFFRLADIVGKKGFYIVLGIGNSRFHLNAFFS